MSFDPHWPPPLVTADLPGIGGRIKDRPEDFEVEEIPAYPPSGQGDFLYLWIEKRDLGAEYFTRQLARRLGIRPEEVGMAGLKDRRAITRQWISVPATAEPQLSEVEGDGIRLLEVSRHGNKLRPGHLHGNRFRIVVRDVVPNAADRLDAIVTRLRTEGLANFYGEQRLGQGGVTVEMGLKMLKEDPVPQRPGKFLRKLALSAAQAALFNHYLARRVEDGLLRRVLPGDVMAKWPFGGMFVAEDMEMEQARFDRKEIVSTGPMFGRKTFAASGEAAEREQQVLADAGLTPAHFHGFGKLLQGTRRHNLVYVDDQSGSSQGTSAILSFALPAGSYATVLLRELMKDDAAHTDDAQQSEPRP